MRIGLPRTATNVIAHLNETVDHLARRGRMLPVPVGNLAAKSDLKTRGPAISFLVNSLTGVDSFILLRNFSRDIGSAKIVTIWPRAALVSTPQTFPIAVNYADSDSSIAGKVAYYWLKVVPASTKTGGNVFVSGPQQFDASQYPAAPKITGDFAVSQAFTPTTQPVTAVTGGAPNQATINVASFLVQYPYGSVSYSSGSITPLLDSTKYYVYCDDPTQKGGALPYIASTLNPSVTGALHRLYLGTVTTPAFGGAPVGGGGGGNGGCFSPETEVWTPRGDIPISELIPGDKVQTRIGWRKVLAVLKHDYDGPLHEMPDGFLVTPDHRIRKGMEWVRAASLFDRVIQYQGPVYNLSIEGETDDEHCYRLANGYLAHNAYK